jgi:uncharacterized protein related to proFAR isomerase
MTKKNEASTTDKAMQYEPLLPDVLRPKTAAEAIKLLEENKTIEFESIYVFDLMRYVKTKKSNFRFTCRVNQLNEGWTVIQHCR